MTTYSNPFTRDFRRKAFDTSVRKLKEMFPNASKEWVHNQATRTARKAVK